MAHRISERRLHQILSAMVDMLMKEGASDSIEAARIIEEIIEMIPAGLSSVDKKKMLSLLSTFRAEPF